MLQVNFLCTSRTTTVPHNFWAASLLWHGVILIKKYNKPLLQKTETKFKKKKNHKKLAQSQKTKRLGRFEIKLDNI